MAKDRKVLGSGINIKLNSVTVGCITGVTPPGRSREQVEIECLNENVSTFISSNLIKQGQLQFTVGWDPSQTAANGGDQSKMLDDLFNQPTHEDRVGSWEIEFAQFNPVVSMRFDGTIGDISPSPVEKNGLLTRQLTVAPTTDITITP